ncbi:MAG: hypothetical protein VYE18_00670 [Pseudomonadota bacterium]|nr:hypothetical protein [Pseudomonadota bacterium]
MKLLSRPPTPFKANPMDHISDGRLLPQMDFATDIDANTSHQGPHINIGVKDMGFHIPVQVSEGIPLKLHWTKPTAPGLILKP